MNTILDGLAQVLGADAVSEIVGMFAKTASATMDGLARAARTESRAVLAREAHAMAGSASCVGLTELASALRAFENALNAGPVDDPAERVAALRELLDRGLLGLTAYRRSVGTTH